VPAQGPGQEKAATQVRRPLMARRACEELEGSIDCQGDPFHFAALPSPFPSSAGNCFSSIWRVTVHREKHTLFRGVLSRLAVGLFLEKPITQLIKKHPISSEMTGSRHFVNRNVTFEPFATSLLAHKPHADSAWGSRLRH